MNFVIKNAKLLHNDGYSQYFHEFESEKIITVHFILPGIIQNSVQINTKGSSVRLDATVQREFRQVWKSQEIGIEGQLSQRVKSGSVRCSYKGGILIADFIKDN